MADMRRVRTMACVLVAMTLMISFLSGSAFAATADSRRKIVILDDPLTPAVFTLLATAGITVLYDLSSLINALAVQLPLLPPIGINPLALLESLGAVTDDVLTFTDPICPTGAVPSGQEYRWGMGQIKAEAAHDDLGPNPSLPGVVKVAVLDTGIAAFHLELNGRIVQGYNAISKTAGFPDDDRGHGTHMAGIILANKNNVGVVGVAGVEPGAPKIKVAPVKVLEGGAGYLSVVINGLQWVKDQYDIDPAIRWVVNMSFSFSRDIDDRPLKQAIQNIPKDIIMVASAGNACCAGGACDDGGGEDCATARSKCTQSQLLSYPAFYQEVLAVGATGINGQAASYSLSKGQGLDVMAPGGELQNGEPDKGQILSTNNDGLYGQGRGTSQAAAHVTGAVALAWSLDPTLSPQEVRNLVTQNDVLNVQDMINTLLP